MFTFKNGFLWGAGESFTKLLKSKHIIRDCNLVWGQQSILHIPTIFINGIRNLINSRPSDSPATNKNFCLLESTQRSRGQKSNIGGKFPQLCKIAAK